MKETTYFECIITVKAEQNIKKSELYLNKKKSDNLKPIPPSTIHGNFSVIVKNNPF